jgi:hypothetical protein
LDFLRDFLLDRTQLDQERETLLAAGQILDFNARFLVIDPLPVRDEVTHDRRDGTDLSQLRIKIAETFLQPFYGHASLKQPRHRPQEDDLAEGVPPATPPSRIPGLAWYRYPHATEVIHHRDGKTGNFGGLLDGEQIKNT